MFGSRLIFGSHFPFRVAQLRDTRARGGKLSQTNNLFQFRTIKIAALMQSLEADKRSFVA